MTTPDDLSKCTGAQLINIILGLEASIREYERRLNVFEKAVAVILEMGRGEPGDAGS